jgi:two-component sensor histidine kinase
VRRLGELDLPDQLAPYVPGWVTQLLMALLATGATALLRAVIDSIAPAAGPFALGFPAVLITTLLGRWQAGVATIVFSIPYQWYFTLPPANSFRLENANDGPRILVALFCYVLIVVIAEIFRRSVRRATDERDQEIADRDLFLDEFDHRVKNNFAIVASLLDMQRRRAGDGDTAQALSDALSRVESIARAHRHLYRGGATPGTVDMASYLQELCSTLSEALFLRGAITLGCTSDHAALPRDRAVSIGLIVNELVTNAAKHAFTGRDRGHIEVGFRAIATGWCLTVRDDGVGVPTTAAPARGDGGLGQRLIEGFVRQAHGTIKTDSGPDGTTVAVTLAP